LTAKIYYGTGNYWSKTIYGFQNLFDVSSDLVVLSHEEGKLLFFKNEDPLHGRPGSGHSSPSLYLVEKGGSCPLRMTVSRGSRPMIIKDSNRLIFHAPTFAATAKWYVQDDRRRPVPATEKMIRAIKSVTPVSIDAIVQEHKRFANTNRQFPLIHSQDIYLDVHYHGPYVSTAIFKLLNGNKRRYLIPFSDNF